MKAPSILSRSVLSLLPIAALLLPLQPASADLYTWDFDPNTAGIQDGGSTALPWTATGGNWSNVTTGQENQPWNNTGTYIAQFGNGTTGTRTVTVSGTVSVAGINFLPLSGTSDYNLSGGSIQLAASSVIGIAQGASTSGTFISISSALSGSDLEIRKTDGTAESFIELSGNNSGLAGTLTLAAPTGYVLLRALNANALGNTTVVAGVGTGLLMGGTAGSTYTSAFQIAGNQNGGRGVIRLDSADLTLSGAITLTADASIGTNGVNGTLSGGIQESSAGLSFQKTGRGTLNLTKASTYSGSTIIAPLTSALGSTPAAGTLHLDFSAPEAPAKDLLYNGQTAGALALTGSRNTAELRITGKSGATNSQAFGDLIIQGATQLTVNSGTGGSVDVALGTITQVTPDATLAITAPASGDITTTEFDGFLGAWATYNSPSASGWARISGGKLEAFTGDTVYATGTNIVSSAASNLTVSAASTGNVTQAAGATLLNTLSMTDAAAPRTVSVGTGNVLQFSAGGGVQLVNGSKDLTVGAAGNAGAVTAGDAAGDKLFLTNHSASSTLTVNSAIQNNAGGAVDVVLNGTGTTVLAGDNTYTGSTTIATGTLEIQSDKALGGGSGGTTVLEGAALHLSGGITVAPESVSLNGTLGGVGSFRNVSGNNTFTGLITLGSESRINSDSGTLTLNRAAAGSVISAGGSPLTFGGAGNIELIDSITINSGIAVTKDGTGTLILGGDSATSMAGTLTVNAGVVRIANANGLGTATSGTTVNAGGTLELADGVTTLAESATLSGTGFEDRGALLVSSGTATYAGMITSGGTSPRINAEAGGTLNLTAATAVRSAINANRTVTFGGGGTINVSGSLADQGTGKLHISKDGAGTLNLSGVNTTTGNLAVTGGTLNLTGTLANAGTTSVTGATLNLDFSAAADNASNRLAPTSVVTLIGGTLSVAGKSTPAPATNSQTLGGLTLGTATTNAAHSRLVLTSGTNGTTNLTFGTFTRNLNAHTLDISLPASGSISVSGSTATGTKGLLVDSRSEAPNAYATVNGSSWAALSAGKIVSGDSVTDFYTASTADALEGNADIAAGVTLTTLDADTSLSSLRFNQAQETTIAESGSRLLTTGGILVTSAVGENDSTISAGKLRPAGTGGSGDLVIIQNNVLGDLTISSVIENTGSAIAVSKAGPGTLILSGANTFSGATRVTGGTLVLQGNNRLNGSSGVQLGGGTESAKLVIGGNQNFGNTQAALAISGSGTDNRVVGGTSSVSTLTLSPGGSQNFKTGFLGGSGTNENNLGLTWRPTSDTHVLQIGNDNTYAGQTVIDRGIVEVGLLADKGDASSLGTGNFSDGDEVIALGGGAGAGTLRYIGSTDSTTDRPVTLASSNTAASPVGVIQNNGTGALKFTSAFTNTGTNTAARTLRLTGTNTGDNEIVGISDGDTAVTAFEKQGTGKWEFTGASIYSGPTNISEGTLVVSGSISGTSGVTVASGATLQLAGLGEIEGGTLSLDSGSVLSLEIGAATANKISLTGGATLAGNITLSLALTALPADNSSFTLIDGGSALSGYTGGARFVYGGLTLNEGDTFNISTAGFSKDFTISYSADGGSDVVLTAVPEPASATMLLAISGMALGLRRFRRRA